MSGEIENAQGNASRLGSTVITSHACNANSGLDQLAVSDSTYLQSLSAFPAVVDTIANVSSIITNAQLCNATTSLDSPVYQNGLEITVLGCSGRSRSE